MALTNPSHSNHNHHHLPALSVTNAADFTSSRHSLQKDNTVVSTISIALPTSPSPPSSPIREKTTASRENLIRQSGSNHTHRQSTTTSTSVNKANRTGLFTLAALAREKTSSAIANLSSTEPILRNRPSGSDLSRQSTLIVHAAPSPTLRRTRTSQEAETRREDRPELPPSPHSSHSQASTLVSKSPTSPSHPGQSLLDTYPPSQAYEATNSNTPSPTTSLPQGNYNKMHQTSSRLLRMTDDERPFTRDFKDLFSTLVVSLPLAMHRVRLTRIEHSFVSEEAINNLGSLKFSQSNRMPDPKDPSRIVTTTTTTTFSMAREMARSVCQRFLDARFIESGDGKQLKEFTMRGNVWQLTPKGIHVLDRFCLRNGIVQKHISDLLASPKNTMQLVILERDSATDKLSSDRSTVEVIFRRFIGQHGPNIKTSLSTADSDSLSDYKDGIAGVKMASERKLGSPPRTVFQTFTGKAASDWLMDCCTTVDRRETWELVTQFIDQELIWCVQPDRNHISQFPAESKFQPTKNSFYQMTAKGKDVLNMASKERVSNGDDAPTPKAGVSRDSNTQKLDRILNDPALRLLFRENLRDTHCEENLSFYLDVDEFLRSCKLAIRAASPTRSGKTSPGQGLDGIKETMASAYGIYNAFLAPGSPCELNIDHMLRNQLATRMTKAVGQDGAMVDSLKEVSKLFEEAQISVFKLMASDSVPKFMKNSKYEQTLRNYDFDSATSTPQSRYNSSNGNIPDRTLSRTGR